METKKEFHWFTIFQYEEEQEYLRKMHKSGWKFVRVSGLGTYHFEKTEPADMVYQLDYNEASTSNHSEYIKMFEDCGWEYLQNYAGYSYFRKSASEMKEDEGIFCDEDSRIAMMERVFKGRMIPLLVIFCMVLVPQFIMNLSNGHYPVAGIIGLILLIYIGCFGTCAAYYRKMKK